MVNDYAKSFRCGLTLYYNFGFIAADAGNICPACIIRRFSPYASAAIWQKSNKPDGFCWLKRQTAYAFCKRHHGMQKGF